MNGSILRARFARRPVAELRDAANAYVKEYDRWLNADKGVRFDKPRRESWESTRKQAADRLPELEDRLRSLLDTVTGKLADDDREG